ncbi:MAG: Type II secretion system protein F [bacterium]|nr:Type II secretion system protein F [bacterium]
MPIYSYQALTPEGKETAGKLEAPDRASVLKTLKGQGLVPVDVVDSAEAVAKRAAGAGRKRRKLKTRELVMFTHQMNSVLKANIPLTQALAIIAGQAESEVLREVLTEVREDIEEGSSLADAMREHPGVFPPLYVNTVRMGEEGGVLDQVMAQLATFIESSYELNSEVKSAMYYPAAIVGMAMLSVSFILIFVMPKMTAVFLESGARLPWATRMLISLGDFMSTRGWVIPIVGVGIFLGMREILKQESGRYYWYRLIRSLPAVGVFVQKVGVTRIAQTMASLLQSGVPALDALRLVAGTLNDAVVRRALSDICDKVQKGQGIARPLAQSGVFPTLFVQMVRVGEESGELESMFSHVASAYSLDVRYAIKNFVSLMEPMIIGVMAVVVMFIVLALALPMMQIGQTMGH